MKKTVRLTLAAFGLAFFNVSAQTPAGLAVQTCAGLSITGAVCTVYSIEYMTDLAQTNTPSAWRCTRFGECFSFILRRAMSAKARASR